MKKDDISIGIDEFGKSAPYKEIYENEFIPKQNCVNYSKIKKIIFSKFMEKIRSFNESLDIKDKRVILRTDLNVPIIKNVIQDETRIDLIIPFVQSLLKKKGKDNINFSSWET